MIKVFIDPDFHKSYPFAFSTIETLLSILGWKSHLVDQIESADLIYLENPHSIKDHQKPLFHSGSQSWQNISESIPATWEKHIIPSKALSKGQLDLFLSAYFFLSGFHEKNFKDPEHCYVPGQGLSVWGCFEYPIVHWISSKLSSILQEIPNLPTPKPLWPKGKSWACCLTHDCDRFFLYRPLGYLRDSLVSIQRGKFSSSCMGIIKSFYSLFFKFFKKDPYAHSVELWKIFEESMGIRSAFYIATRSRFEKNGSFKDVSYLAQDPAIVKIALSLVNNGWEVGLHSSICSWKGTYREEKDRIEKLYHTKVSGFRGHWWSHHPEDPLQSIALASKTAQFEYDSSLGMNKSHGYRRGIAYPYEIFNLKTGKRESIFEIPPIMMDESIYLCEPHSKQDFWKRVNDIKKYQGCFVMDFHSDGLAPNYFNNTIINLLPEIEKIASDPECWFTTPQEIVQWCKTKRWE